MASIPELSDDEWLRLFERLTHYADRKLIRLNWRGMRGSQGGRPAGGVQAEDLAQQAIIDLIQGNRVWDKERQPDLLKHLQSVVDSKVSHLVQRVENRSTVRIGSTADTEVLSPAYDVPSRELNPADVVASREEEKRFRAAIYEALASDEHAYKFLECLEAGLEYQEIAEYLDITAADVNNIKKRLCRKVEKVRNDLSKGGPNG